MGEWLGTFFILFAAVGFIWLCGYGAYRLADYYSNLKEGRIKKRVQLAMQVGGLVLYLALLTSCIEAAKP